jgi:diguanylate cyclase (GGDEF)-like protein
VLIVLLGLLFGTAAFVVARRERAARQERIRFRARQERFGEAMQVAASQAEAHTLLKSHLERSINGAAVTVLNRNNSADRLEATTPVDSDSPLAERLPQATPRSCLAVRLSRPFQQADRNEVYDCQVCGGLADGTTCQPLLVGGEVIGSVLTERGTSIDATDGERISQAVAQAAPVLANLRNLAIAEMRAATDSLTGLPNRRAVDDTLLRMLAQAGRTFEPLSVVLLDLDHFKTINDTLGHDRGDEVLAGVGACLREAIRDSDFAGRSGGEEFVMFLAGTDRSGAVRVAEKVRVAMRALRVAGMERSVTASFGVACFPDDAVEPPALMRSADRALYAAKRAGRNRIESSSRGAPGADGEAQFERSTQ